MDEVTGYTPPPRLYIVELEHNQVLMLISAARLQARHVSKAEAVLLREAADHLDDQTRYPANG